MVQRYSLCCLFCLLTAATKTSASLSVISLNINLETGCVVHGNNKSEPSSECNPEPVDNFTLLH